MSESKAVEGEASSIIIEAIEPEAELGKAIQTRQDQIPTYGIYGPPDLCYLVKEIKKGFLSGEAKQGFYHYVYGVDTSSSASVAAYMTSILANSETQSEQAAKK